MSNELSSSNSAATPSVSPVRQVPFDSEAARKHREEMDRQIAEFKVYCREQLPILKAQEKAYVVSEIKTRDDFRKYWRLREQILVFEDTIIESKYYPAEWYRACMRHAVEHLKAAKEFSEEVHEHVYEHHACMEMDFCGEAHCKVGTQYFPRYGELAVGEEKEIWEEVLRLGCDYHDLMPRKVRERLDAIYKS